MYFKRNFMLPLIDELSKKSLFIVREFIDKFNNFNSFLIYVGQN